MLTTQSGGLCVVACQGAGDCRNDYVWLTVTGTASAACIPAKASQCDPAGDPVPQGRSCAAGQRCVPFSPDHSYGSCAVECDPLVQGCTDMASLCLVDRDDPKGVVTCLGTVNPTAAEGDPCFYLNSCAAGYQCQSGKCRRYCRMGGDPCPAASPHCVKIVGARFDTGVLGVCAP